jgi:hypothetical protein
MPRVTFTGNLQRHLDCPPADVPGATVREALEAVFAQNPRARGYVLDDQGAVRRHVVIFVGGQPVNDRQRLSDPVSPGAEIAVGRNYIDATPTSGTLYVGGGGETLSVEVSLTRR